MGCASSKGMDVKTAAVYKPPPASFAVFDINAIEEPWLKHLNSQHEQDNQKLPNTHVPAPILHKLNLLDSTEAPQSWDEVSKALQDFKTTPTKPPSTNTTNSQSPPPTPPQAQPQPRKTMSFHTLEELDAKLNPKPEPKPKPKPKPELTKAATTDWNSNSLKAQPPPPITNTEEKEGGSLGIKPLKDNIFIVRDRLERQKEDKGSSLERIRRDPLSQFPEKCPPGGGDAVVLYTTSLGGVRKTFEECNRAREVLEAHRVVVDERDVSLHGEFLRELKELAEGEGVKLPRVFVKGRYVGGFSELVELNETGRLGRILNATRVERGAGRQACVGCGGARFVPCLDCGGSCKVGPDRERCPNCNENGLAHCPACN